MLNFIAAFLFTISAHASDEMSTELKVDPTKAVSAPAVETKSQSPSNDPALRAKIRQKAPFWISDSRFGTAIRINKDGTFSSENQGGGSIAGSWKALKSGELQIVWGDAQEKYTYPVKFKSGVLSIAGKTAKKNRFTISNH